MPTLYDLATAASHAVERARTDAHEAHFRDVPAALVRLGAARDRFDDLCRMKTLAQRAHAAVERGERVLMVLPRHITSDDVVAMLVTWPTLVAVDVTEPCDTAGVEAHEAAWKGTVIA